MDGRRFADEYVRRKKLAEKGVFEKNAGVDNRSTSGGWSEVAKKGGNAAGAPVSREPESAVMAGAAFRVVSGKKKGKK